MGDETTRRLRADAQVNQDSLVEAATRAFARDGANASLKAIAQDAGVGIGTLYRRFPTRETLVWAIYRKDVDRICASVPRLLGRQAPIEALRTWMESFLDFLAVKRGMAEALKAALATDDSQRLHTRSLITGALQILLDAGRTDTTIRDDIAALDVMMALGGIALIAGEPEQRDQAARLLDLLIAGLRPIQAKPKPKPAAEPGS
ncbi:MAG: transcriptional regulator [Pseudonocardiales bacterium]|nr:transcriptional regulator [Pseudonocardiales bacterium]